MASLPNLQQGCKHQDIPQVCVGVPYSVPVNVAKSSTDCCVSCLIVSGAIIFCLLFGGYVGFVCYLSFITEPQRQFPQFQIEQLSVSLQHNLSESHQIWAKWEIGVSVANPTTFSGLEFQKINMLVRYNQGSSAGVVIPPFPLGRETTTLQNATVLVSWQECNYINPLNVEVELQVDFEYRDWISSIDSGSRDGGKALCKNIQIGFSSEERGSMLKGPISCPRELIMDGGIRWT